ncbi:MAG TPA: proline dehydrogenase family protein [Candidatus Acidoferrum sp.]|jgi:proline dehydrogenase|nr:proline dehydrogenase family protein [Candidatus Acidoferrum sp.]
MAIIDRLLAPGSGFQKNFFFLAKRFVAGETIGSAIEAVRSLNAAGMTATLDFLGEDVLERDAAIATREAYIAMLERIRETGVQSNVSVKMSAMGLLIDDGFALDNLTRILHFAQRNADPFVRIDMEGSAVTQITLDLFERAYAQDKNVGIVLQAYLKRTPSDVARMIELGARVRLCKGAYSEPAEIALKEMPEIRRQYVSLAKDLLDRGNYPAIATHDRELIDEIRTYVRERGIARDRFEFQMLYGIRPQLQRELVADGYRLRIYVPYGTHWAGYFFRRVMERRENAIFALSSMWSK